MADSPPRGFDETEFISRTRKAQSLLQVQGLAGLLVMTEPEVRYFSGFHTPFWQSPTRPWFLFVPTIGDPVALIPSIGADLMGKTWLSDIRTWSAPAPQDNGVSLLTDLLNPYAKRKDRIGLLKGHETTLRMPLADYERLVATLPGLEFTDATDVVRSLRMVKSEAEIAKLSYVCAIGGRSFARLPSIARTGLPLEDLFRTFRQEALAEGADEVPYLVGGADQNGYHDVISPPSRRLLRDGDILMLDTGIVWDGYHCDFDRNFAIGPPDALSRQAYEVLWTATEAGLAAARPGITCRDLFSTMYDEVSKWNGPSGDVGRFGHGLGMQLTEWPSIAAFDETVITENMVLTLEPSLGYGAGRIMVHEENIVVRADGAQLLTPRAARNLPML